MCKLIDVFLLTFCRIFVRFKLFLIKSNRAIMKRIILKSKISDKIKHSRRLVFMRSDFEELGGYDQVGRVLRNLIAEGKLIKIGYGLYAKARTNRLTGKPMLIAKGGFIQVAKEALRRLGVKWSPSDSEISYLEGSTQIPANAEFIIFDRFNRKIATDKFKLQLNRS